MITETSIVRMLLDSHDLNTVITGFGYTGKYLFTKLIVSTNLLFLLGHADMTFVNQQRISRRFKCFFLNLKGFSGFQTCALKIFVFSS